jgi:RNA polymerase sigma factor (sigma-70 family)
LHCINNCLKAIQTYNEQELVQQIRQKDQQAFSYLYDNYAAVLNSVIYRMTEDKALSEDILQETFVKIWNNFGNYDASKGKLFTWMINVTRNLTIDKMRGRDFKKQQKTTGVDFMETDVADRSSGANKAETMALHSQVNQLKPEQRNIINLAYFGGYKQEEISVKLGIPLGTVKTRLRAAIIELRKHM